MKIDSTSRHLPPVRPAAPAELAGLPAVETAADTLFAPLGITELPPAGTVEELRSAAAVLVCGEPPVGFARLELLDGQAHLEQLAVRPEYGRRGIGAALVEAAVRWADERGYGEITLTTYRDILWNGPFYARHGFEVVERPSGELAEARRVEERIGLDAHGARVAMRRVLLDYPRSPA